MTTMVRCVHVLPADLVARVREFRTEKRLSSDVEAVRRLLDEALRARDTADSLCARIESRLNAGARLPDVLRAEVVGHPLVARIETPDPRNAVLILRSGERFAITHVGVAKEEPAP